MFLLFINLCISTLLLPCICHSKTVLIRPPRNMEKSRILSGYNCSTNDHPFMVKIQKISKANRVRHSCTGTILTPYHVLTAGHCCEHPDQIAVAGANSPHRTERYVIAMYTHPKYNRYYLDKYPRDDVCVLLLESAFEYSRYITKVRLPTKALSIDDFEKKYKNKKGFILGWGWPYEPGKSDYDHPAELHCSKIPIIDYITCSNLYPATAVHYGRTVCTYEENHGICFGDSGGPLLSEDNIQIGISSWGVGCGRKDKPDVYTRTDQYLDFLELFLQRARIAENTAGFQKLNIWVFGFAINIILFQWI